MAHFKHKTVLFLCTGNYYRSRFAEILFNSVAGKTGATVAGVVKGTGLGAGPVTSVFLWLRKHLFWRC